MYTASSAFLEALQEAGVSYIFANFGSDHPALIESLTDAQNKGIQVPQVIISPHEFVAMSAAHGYAQATGEPQAVVVHVECGTQNLGGAIHNAFKAKVPVLVYAGASPYTQEGELLGSRNEFIHWYQDVKDQRGIMRNYAKYDNEIRSGLNVKQLTFRALQIAKSEPQGPVYLMGPRETMEQQTERVALDYSLWQPIANSALPAHDIDTLLNQLRTAKKPLIVTSYLGKVEAAVPELQQLCEQLAIPVLESVPQTMNFPGNHPLHVGYQWNENVQHPFLAEADVIVVFDSDVPWIPTKNKPSSDAIIYYIDADPLKEEMPLWYIPSVKYYRASSVEVLKQLNSHLQGKKLPEEEIQSRRKRVAKYHEAQHQAVLAKESIDDKVITPHYLTACIRELVDEDTIILNEAITSYGIVTSHLKPSVPGSYFSSGAGSLGWNGGAAIGMKLAHPNKTVISLTGDGSYLFSIPSVVYAMAAQYNTPFLTVIYNNVGWNAPRHSTLGVHPNGIAQQSNQFWNDFNPNSELAFVAKATGGAYAETVEHPSRLKEALKIAMAHVKEGRCAVLDVKIPRI